MSGLISDVAFGGVICAAGDACAQSLGQRSSSAGIGFDLQRTGAVASYGAAAAIPYSVWYRRLAVAFPGQSLRAVAGKTACELMIALPIFEIPAFTIWTGYFGRGETLHESSSALQSGWASGVLAGWSVWGPASVLTFAVVKQPRNQLRTLYTAGAVWACVISWLSFEKDGALDGNGGYRR